MTFTVQDPPVCVCGHHEALHDLGTRKAELGRRTACSVMDAQGQCGCVRFAAPTVVSSALD